MEKWLTLIPFVTTVLVFLKSFMEFWIFLRSKIPRKKKKPPHQRRRR